MKRITYTWDDMRLRESFVARESEFDDDGSDSQVYKIIEVTDITGSIVEIKLSDNTYLTFELEHFTEAVANYKSNRVKP